MIVKLYTYFGIVGIASILAWLGALAMIVNYAWHARRTFFYARALALALAGLVLAQVNSIHVNRIEVDRRQDIQEARERQHRAQRGGADMLNSKTAGLRFAEDGRDDSLDMAGVASADKRSVYEQAADEHQPASDKKPRKARWMEQSGEEPAPGVKLLPERDVARANRLDMLNLWMARFILILILFLLILDYFLRFNRTVGTILPLPFAGRIVDSLFPKSHSAVFRAGNPGLLPGQLETIVRKGETFIYFGESRVIGTPALSRVVLPLRDVCRSAVAVFRPNTLLKLLERLSHGSGRSRLLKTGRLGPRVKALCRAGFAVSGKGIRTLWRWIAAPFRWLVQKAAAFSWIRKSAAFIGRPFRNAIRRLGPCGQRLIEWVRRGGRNIRSGTIEFWPAIILDASPDKAFDQDFIFECVWFNRYGFTVEDLNRSTALLTGLRKFIGERRVPRAAAAKTVHVLWNFPASMNPELLRPLAVCAREVNIKLIVFAADARIAEIGQWVEEVCPDEAPPRAHPSLFALGMARMRRIPAHLQPWLARQRQQRKARRERVSAERAAQATTADAKPKSPAATPVIAGHKAPNISKAPAPAPQIPSAQIPKPEVKIKPSKLVVPTPALKPVAPIPKSTADVKAPAPAPTPMPAEAPAPIPAPMPKLKVPQPQPVPVPTALPKVKAAQPIVGAPPKPVPKFEVPQPKAKPSVMPIVKTPSVAGGADFNEIKLKPFEKPGHVILTPKIKMKMPPAATPALPVSPAEEPKMPKPPPEARASSSQIAEVNQAAGVFKFYCPSCQQKLSAQMDWQKKTILCPACKTPITIPTL